MTSTSEERSDISRLVSAEQAIEGFSGRIVVWKELINHAVRSPVYGWGFTAYDKIDLHGPSHAHNIYIGTILNFGAIGLVLLITIIVTCLKSTIAVINKSKDPYLFSIARILFVCFFLITLLGFTNDIKGGLEPVFFTFLAMISKMQELHVKSINKNKAAIIGN